MNCMFCGGSTCGTLCRNSGVTAQPYPLVRQPDGIDALEAETAKLRERAEKAEAVAARLRNESASLSTQLAMTKMLASEKAEKLDQAHMMIASLVKKAGGEVTLSIGDLVTRGRVEREDDGLSLAITLRSCAS